MFEIVMPEQHDPPTRFAVVVFDEPKSTIRVFICDAVSVCTPCSSFMFGVPFPFLSAFRVCNAWTPPRRCESISRFIRGATVP